MQERTEPATSPRPRSGTGTPRRVFVRPGALALQRPGKRRAPVHLPAPDADRAIQTLEEFGYEVVMLAQDGDVSAAAARDWLLTDDPDDCRWARRAGVRTVLVGGDATEQAAQPDRCDLTVSSAYNAAIEVVIREPDGRAAAAPVQMRTMAHG